MIQLNLLPDVKMQYLKAQRTRRLVTTVVVLCAAVSLVILLLLLSADGLQKKHMKDLANDIDSETHQLQNEPQINRMLTVQNQLESLTGLHAKKPAADRLFVYLNESTPKNVFINDLTVDFGARTIAITGTSGSLANVNTYIDSLKHATFTIGKSKSSKPAFSNIVLTSFGLNTSSQNAGQAANYTINLDYDQTIFNITQNVQLSVPNENITRLNTGQPTDIFQAAPPNSNQTAPSSGSAGGQ